MSKTENFISCPWATHTYLQVDLYLIVLTPKKGNFKSVISVNVGFSYISNRFSVWLGTHSLINLAAI